MNSKDKLNEAFNLLKSINCPKPILDALWLFSLTVYKDDIKLNNWNAWSEEQLVEGESLEIVSDVTSCLSVPPSKPLDITTIVRPSNHS